jgi:choline dehydrogenase
MKRASDTQIDSAEIARDAETAAFVERVRVNQEKLAAGLKSQYDFIVCGAGTSGSVLARRLAENPDVSVLLLEAGGNDETPSVTEAIQWRANLGSERSWNFQAQPGPDLNGRSMPMNMGKVLGGGSSINAMYWVRGHKTDWDFFASEANDPAWNYESVKSIYQRIEDWGGEPDIEHRGTGGPVFVWPTRLQPVGIAMCESARSIGIPTFGNLNGRMMEAEGGCSASEFRIRDGRRLSIFRSYTFPYMDRPNLTVLTHATVTRLIMDGKRASGVEIACNSKVRRIGAGLEVVLSLGAINTPKVLMQSGIGDRSELRRLGIPLVAHLPGVGQNFQDHFVFASCVWECKEPIEESAKGQALLFWKSDAAIETPDMQVYQGINLRSGMANLQPSTSSMSLVPSIVRPRSRGHLRLTGPDPLDPVEIHANVLEDPGDLKAITVAIDLCREIGNSAVFESLLEREVTPGNLKGPALEQVVRNSVSTIWHQSCTARMGRDSMSVVDGHLRAHGIDSLRIADGSIMPRITTGNTMAPCVVIGERCAEILKAHHRI